ncbi:MAG: DUF4430 domain-containing protein [Candidatus Hadarchaeales archaeon]
MIELRKIWAEVVGLIIVAGVLCFAAGLYASGGGPDVYATTREITIHLRVETKSSGVIERDVTIRDGMTAFDALLRVADTRTKFWESFGSSVVVSIAGDELESNEGYVFEVNGEAPNVGMSECQLHDGDNVVIKYISW